MQSAVTAGYTRRGDPERREAALTLIDAVSVEDALGLFLAASPGADLSGMSGTSGLIHVNEEHDRVVWTAWRGQRVVCIDAAAADGVPEALERLGGRVLLSTPGEAVPAELPFRLFEAQRPRRLSLVRSVAAITAGLDPSLHWEDPQTVDRLLGLVGDVWLVTAGLGSPTDDETNFVFAARYPTPADAAEAYSRCVDAADRGELAILLTEPVNEVLAGSWTPDVESSSPALPALRKALEAEQAGRRTDEKLELRAASR